MVKELLNNWMEQRRKSGFPPLEAHEADKLLAFVDWAEKDIHPITEKIIMEGELELVIQWDLDHHESTLHVNGESIAYLLIDKLLPNYNERNSSGEQLGNFIITFERRPTKDAPDLGESSASDNESKPAPSG